MAAVPAMLRPGRQPGGSRSHQVHSITARSVSRQFRECLKAGKPGITDTIFKLPEAREAGAGREEGVVRQTADSSQVVLIAILF